MGLSARIRISRRYKNLLARVFLYLVTVLSFISSYVFMTRLQDTISKEFMPQVRAISSDSLDSTISEYFTKNNYDYNDFLNIKYNNDDKITSIQTNTSLINKVKSDLSLILQNEIEVCKKMTVTMPASNVFDNFILHAISPDVKVLIRPTEVSDIEIKDSLEDVGINQMRYELYLEARVIVSINCYSMIVKQEIYDKIPIAEAIIVCDVPQYYSVGGTNQIIPELKED